MTIDEKQFEQQTMSGVKYAHNTGWFIEMSALKEFCRQQFSKKLETIEIYLDDLGEFPLKKENIYMVEKDYNVTINEAMQVPEILRNSRIPVFYGSTHVFIPEIAGGICRYFAEMWSPRADLEQSKLSEIISGLCIINSFTGGQL